MNRKPQIKTKKMNDGTYAWKLLTTDGYPTTWERTEARTPWGARVQGDKYLKAELAAWEALKTWNGYVPNDFAAPYAAR